MKNSRSTLFLRRVIREPLELSTAWREAGGSELEGNWGLSKLGDGRRAGRPASPPADPGPRPGSFLVQSEEGTRVDCAGSEPSQARDGPEAQMRLRDAVTS